jgi:hypothetical protein
MNFPHAKSFFKLICLCALVTLQACASEPRVLYKDRVVEVPLPVRTPLDPRLTVDCEPRNDPPMTGALPVSAVLDRLAAVEDALEVCRLQLEALRNLK